MTNVYREREITGMLLAALADMPVVALTGMRQVGKSTLLQHQPQFTGRRYVTLDDFAQLEAARADPEGFLAGRDPLTVDEAQKCPELLPVIKQLVDRDRTPGRFLLSGSASFTLPHRITESLAGRAVYFTLRPFSRREVSGALNGEPFIRRFFRDGLLPAAAQSVRPVEAREVLRGGMPSVCLGEVADPAIWYKGFEQTYLERDVRELSQVGDLWAFRRMLVLTALRTGQVLRVSELARDAKLNATTCGRYLDLLEASFVVERLPPFLGNRASRLIKSPKLYFADPGLAAHLAGVSSLGMSEPLRGALFETFAACNLAGILEARWPEAKLHYWNVQGRHEVDFVVEVGRETLAMEVKAASRWDRRDLAGLKAFLSVTPSCRAAVLVHNGTQAVALGPRLWALPLGLVLS
ncbi:MAG: ATP-binding protein [Thermaerobacter sp.]|nr:ATP-binding protein [Thermaerobacter sp.]